MFSSQAGAAGISDRSVMNMVMATSACLHASPFADLFPRRCKLHLGLTSRCRSSILDPLLPCDGQRYASRADMRGGGVGWRENGGKSLIPTNARGLSIKMKAQMKRAHIPLIKVQALRRGWPERSTRRRRGRRLFDPPCPPRCPRIISHLSDFKRGGYGKKRNWL